MTVKYRILQWDNYFYLGTWDDNIWEKPPDLSSFLEMSPSSYPTLEKAQEEVEHMKAYKPVMRFVEEGIIRE